MTNHSSSSRQQGLARRAAREWFEARPSFHTGSAEALADVLEARQAEMHCRVDAADILRLVASGQGRLTATRAAIAFTVDHGPIGIELRYLYVARGRRHRGAGQALVARLRALYAGRHMFCCCFNERLARSAQLAGFTLESEGQGWWQMTTRPASLDAYAPDTAQRQAPLPEPCPPPRMDALAVTEEERVRNAVKAFMTSALAAVAAASCLDA